MSKTPKNVANAILTDGRLYALMMPNAETPTLPTTHTFMNGEAKPITQEIMDALQERAVDLVSVGSGRNQKEESRCKFEFTDLEVADEVVPATPAPRTRTAPKTNA